MKRLSLGAAIAAILLPVVFITGCSKPVLIPPPGKGANLCNIKKMHFILGAGMDTITFVYNSLGNPIRGDRVDVGTGAPRYIFRYDNKNRLQDYIGAYNNGAAEFWTRYTYNADKTVTDSTYTLVDQFLTWPPTFSGDFHWGFREFDQQGRVSLITSYFTDFFNDVDTVAQPVTYDAEGNASNGGPYDNKVNYHQTNKIWQFVDNQYSVNNPIPIDAYNSFGLPTKINFEPNTLHTVLFTLAFPQTVIEYDCDVPKGY